MSDDLKIIRRIKRSLLSEQKFTPKALDELEVYLNFMKIPSKWHFDKGIVKSIEEISKLLNLIETDLFVQWHFLGCVVNFRKGWQHIKQFYLGDIEIPKSFRNLITPYGKHFLVNRLDTSPHSSKQFVHLFANVCERIFVHLIQYDSRLEFLKGNLDFSGEKILISSTRFSED